MIRAAAMQDVPAILEIYRPYILETAYTFEYEVPSLEAFRQRFLAITAEHPWLVWEEAGEILGYAYGEKAFGRAAFQWDADLAIYLRPECHGRGIGRALYTAVEEILRQQGYLVAYGVVTSSNTGSCAFHRAMGYRELAEFPACGWKFDRWYGVTWFEKRLQDGDPAKPPVSWRELERR